MKTKQQMQDQALTKPPRAKKFYGIKLDAWKPGPNAGPRMTQLSSANH